jgi:thiamine-phosphate pyrophosphorylase
MKPLPRLYAIADASFADPISLAENLFSGGVRLLQLRNKKGSPREVLTQVEAILSFAPPDAEIIVNDRVDVALIADDVGVHLGQFDLSPTEARRVLGADRTIGFSTHNLQQALQADKLPVDYIALGPIFPTSSKDNPDPVVGLDRLAAICRSVRKPVVAIGGIQLVNAVQVLEAGASSIAVIRDLLASDDISSRARQWCESVGTS